MKASKTSLENRGQGRDELEPVLEFWEQGHGVKQGLQVALFGEDSWGQLALHTPCKRVIMHVSGQEW